MPALLRRHHATDRSLPPSAAWGGGVLEGYDGPVKPGGIPTTDTPARYISFHAALNLRAPGEVTGGWHAHTALHVPARSPDRPLPCAGDGERVNTNPALGTHGVRDMGTILRTLYGPPAPGGRLSARDPSGLPTTSGRLPTL